MFPQLKADFADRVREVDLYFQMLCGLDNDELAVVNGSGPQILPVGSPPADWGRMLKGAAYLVLYNLVEAFVRRGFQALFEAMKSDSVSAAELTNALREQWVMQKNRKISAFDGSPKVYMGIAHDIVAEIIEKKVAALSRVHLPFSGNLDADEIREVCRLHGVSHDTHKDAKGGVALNNVKKKRNSLSHGDESFVECGRSLTSADLLKAKKEVVLFLQGILDNLEEFAVTKSYKV